MPPFDSPSPLVMHVGHPTIYLLQLTPQDAQALFALIDADRTHLSRFGQETAAKYPTFETVEEILSDWEHSPRLRMGIWFNTTLVGALQLDIIPPGTAAQLNFWVASQYCGKGYGSAAVRTLLTHARLHYNLETIRVGIDRENAAARQVLKNAGFIDRGDVGDHSRWFSYKLDPFNTGEEIVSRLGFEPVLSDICAPTRAISGGHTKISLVRMGEIVTIQPTTLRDLLDPEYIDYLEGNFRNAGWTLVLDQVPDTERRIQVLGEHDEE